MPPIIDYDLCSKCGNCTKVCPVYVYIMARRKMNIRAYFMAKTAFSAVHVFLNVHIRLSASDIRCICNLLIMHFESKWHYLKFS